VELSVIKENLEPQLKKGLVSSRILLDGLRMIDESSRRTAAYQDPYFVPFYYYLGKLISPKYLVEMGFGIGLFTSCFLKSCQSVERILGFELKREGFYSPRLGIANVNNCWKPRGILDVYVGGVMDDAFTKQLEQTGWDLAFVSDTVPLDTHRLYLEVLWERMNFDGMIVVDYLLKDKVANDAFVGFSKIVNRKPVFFETRYGVGIIQK
jgi:hypothetical protein